MEEDPGVDIETLIDEFEYIPGHFHLEMNLNFESCTPAEFRRRDIKLKRDALQFQLEFDSSFQNSAIKNLLGVFSFYLDEIDNAKEIFDNITKQETDNLNAWANLAYVYDRLNLEEEASHCTDRISHLMGLEAEDSSSKEPRLRAARCLAEQGYAYAYDVGLLNEEDSMEKLMAGISLYDKALNYSKHKISLEEIRSWYFTMASLCMRLDEIFFKKEEPEVSRLLYFNKTLMLLREVVKSSHNQYRALSWCYIGMMLEKQHTFSTTPMGIHDYGFSGTDPLDCFSKIYIRMFVRDLERAKMGLCRLPDRNHLTSAKSDLESIINVYPCLKTYLELGKVWYYMGVDAVQELLLTDENALNTALVCIAKAMEFDLGVTLPELQLLKGKCLRVKSEELNAIECFRQAIQLDNKGSLGTETFRCLMETLLSLYHQNKMDATDLIQEVEFWVKNTQEKYTSEAVSQELQTVCRNNTIEIVDLSKAMIAMGKMDLVKLLFQSMGMNGKRPSLKLSSRSSSF
uniref:Tetratricopeptide repeat domain 22 n=1 Tax=Pyxicephalus adspersus TaxID=30357 RepID=A0AAV2ZJE3_PYXAD|nr:TPA: hypothetical protein GDO54_016271 [Pyxicephalus adspersus]